MLAVGIGATSSELRKPCSACDARGAGDDCGGSLVVEMVAIWWFYRGFIVVYNDSLVVYSG